MNTDERRCRRDGEEYGFTAEAQRRRNGRKQRVRRSMSRGAAAHASPQRKPWDVIFAVQLVATGTSPNHHEYPSLTAGYSWRGRGEWRRPVHDEPAECG